MKLNGMLNLDRVNSMRVDPNAYIKKSSNETDSKAKSQQIEKVLFPEPYQNVSPRYNKQDFYKSEPVEQVEKPTQTQLPQQSNMMDFKSILPMIMSGKFNDMLKPIMSLLGGNAGGGGIGDIAKIFELFKPKQKSKVKKDVSKDEDVSSKFDDMIIIED